MVGAEKERVGSKAPPPAGGASGLLLRVCAEGRTVQLSAP